MSQSIIQKDKYCYLTGGTHSLDKHHVLPGVANRKKCERLGLWVWLDHDVHMAIHYNHSKTHLRYKLIRIGQAKYEEKHTREEWMNEFHKNYLED